MNQAIEPKMALCVSADIIHYPMEDWSPYLVDRAICDDINDVDASVLQLLPYVTIYRKGCPELDERHELYALRYTRGSAGAETRLHALHSIGFGGHIDTNITTSLLNLIVDETMRELKEELSFVPPLKTIHSAVFKAMAQRRLIYVPDTLVGSVHLGLSIMIDLDDCVQKNMIPELNQITDLKWVCIGEDYDNCFDSAESYEPWSQLLIDTYRAQVHAAASESVATNDAPDVIAGVAAQLIDNAHTDSLI